MRVVGSESVRRSEVDWEFSVRAANHVGTTPGKMRAVASGEALGTHATKLRMARLGRRSLVLSACAALAFACTSPTLPLPPPTAPSITMGTEPNTWRLTSQNGVQPNALVLAVNRNESLPRTERVSGTIADEQGSWEMIVIGRTGDFVDVSQESGTTSSAPTTIQLK